MKKTILALTIRLATAVLVALFSGPAMAKVTGRCDNCHTMHNSQGGTAMAEDRSSWYDEWPELGTPPYGTLLTDTCVGCHSSDGSGGSYPTYDLGGCLVPVVNYIGSGEPSDYLAGGNFYWVADSGGNNDAKGHNVLGISEEDTLPLAPGGFNCGGANCHVSLAVPPTNTSIGLGGCQGCHLRPAHHADDSNVVVGSEVGDDDGFYRFLSGHYSGDTHGVCGIEDADWEAGHPNHTPGGTSHNEYGLGIRQMRSYRIHQDQNMLMPLAQMVLVSEPMTRLSR